MSGRVVHVKDNVPGAVYIGRANGRHRLVGSPLGNPFKIGRDGERSAVIQQYRHWLARNLPVYPVLRETLISCRDKPLACWCRHDADPRTPENACHGDVLLDFLQRYTDDELRVMGGDA